VRRPYFGGSLQRAGGGKGRRGERDAQELWLMLLPMKGGVLTTGTMGTTMCCCG